MDNLINKQRHKDILIDLMNSEERPEKACPSSNGDLQGNFDELVKFLEYEEAFTVDPKTQRRIKSKLIELGLWK